MDGEVVARFLVDHPVLPGMIRAIIDTLTAQGGAYVPHLVRRASDEEPRRITWARPTGLLDEVAEPGTTTTFLRVSDGQPAPVLSFRVSASPRTRPTGVTLQLPATALTTSRDIEQVLGVCKGLYLFLESPWGTVRGEPVAGVPEARPVLEWATFVGPRLVTQVGPARLLTSMAFIVEILPDGGIMLVSHASPDRAGSAEGAALRRLIGASTGLADVVRRTGVADEPPGPRGRVVRIRRPDRPGSVAARTRRPGESGAQLHGTPAGPSVMGEHGTTQDRSDRSDQNSRPGDRAVPEYGAETRQGTTPARDPVLEQPE